MAARGSEGMLQYLAALDQGTTSTRCMIFDRAGNVMGVSQREHEQIYPRPGWVEHDPEEIWRASLFVMEQACSMGRIAPSEIAAVGITNQRETTVVWDRHTGEAVTNAIVWQDTRVSEYVSSFAREGGGDRFRQKTGLPLATYFSGLKLLWVLDHVATARERG